MYEIVIGHAERDLFDRPGVGHRTYLATDGHYYTGVDCWDVQYACAAHCRDALLEPYPVHAVELVTDGWRTCDVHVVPADDGTGYHVDASVYDLNPDNVPDYQHPIICGHCDTVIIGPTPATAACPHPENYTVTVDYPDGSESTCTMATLAAATAHAETMVRMTAPRPGVTVTIATRSDYHGTPWERTVTARP